MYMYLYISMLPYGTYEQHLPPNKKKHTNTPLGSSWRKRGWQWGPAVFLRPKNGTSKGIQDQQWWFDSDIRAAIKYYKYMDIMGYHWIYNFYREIIGILDDFRGIPWDLSIKMSSNIKKQA